MKNILRKVNLFSLVTGKTFKHTEYFDIYCLVYDRDSQKRFIIQYSFFVCDGIPRARSNTCVKPHAIVLSLCMNASLFYDHQ